VHQHHGAAVGLAVGGDVHVTHLQGFPLGLKGKVLECVGILKTLQLRTIGRAVGGGCFRCGGMGKQRQRGAEEQAGQPAGERDGHRDKLHENRPMLERPD